MIYYKDDKFSISKEKITYKHGEKTISKCVGSEGKQWWLDFETKWSDMEILEFKGIEIPDKQLERLEEINELRILGVYGELVENYVMFDEFPEGVTHPLRQLQIKKQNEQLLIQSAENTAETIEAILILNEMQKVEQAESNTELIELIMMMQGGM